MRIRRFERELQIDNALIEIKERGKKTFGEDSFDSYDDHHRDDVWDSNRPSQNTS